MIERFAALVLIILLLPVWVILSLLILILDGPPVIFFQERLGRERKPFLMWKFRTMVRQAENMQAKLKRLNEAEGPVFKIHNDPRYTGLGKFLSHTGLDELPQLFNIFWGNMAFAGPRPLPTSEAGKIPKLYNGRFKVRPGIVSPWVVGGYHRVGFNKWMESDVWYANHKNFLLDMKLYGLAGGMIVKMLKDEIGIRINSTKEINKAFRM